MLDRSRDLPVRFKHRDLTSVPRQGANRFQTARAGLTDLRFPVPRLSEQPKRSIQRSNQSRGGFLVESFDERSASASLKSALSSSLLSGEIQVAAGGA